MLISVGLLTGHSRCLNSWRNGFWTICCPYHIDSYYLRIHSEWLLSKNSTGSATDIASKKRLFIICRRVRKPFEFWS